jgi:competence protein ComFC
MKCMLCRETFTHQDKPICFKCTLEMEKLRINAAICKVCGNPIFLTECCTLNCDNNIPLDGYMGAFYYRGIVKRLLQLYKFEELHSLKTLFAEIINEYCLKYYPNWHLQIIPPHWKKMYNQGWDQLKGLHKYLKNPRVDLLYRSSKKYQGQKHKNREDRWNKIQGQFKVKKRIIYIPEKVLIIDDIRTSGATLVEAARVLKSLGIARVNALTLAMD